MTTIKLIRGLFSALVVSTIASASFANTIDYYRFENNLTDSGTGAHNGSVLAGSPTFSSSVPSATIPQTGQTDTKSVVLGGSDAISVGSPFPFDTLTNATLEFYVNPTNTGGEEDLFWTTTSSGDANRFNINLANGHLDVDYREAGGTLHGLFNQVGGVNYGQWNFIAIVKTGNSYSAYVNGTLFSATDSSPNLPTSTGWTINGRAALPSPNCGTCQFQGLVDEVRLSDQALTPSQFLNSTPVTSSTPEPASYILWGLGIGVVAAGRLFSRRNPML
jgi:hypothetical protein